MGLFRRKPPHPELEVERCPHCREPVPEEAAICNMCGMPLDSRADAPREQSAPRD
jgi:predicted amidophosphoribosyltransferase